MKWHHRSDREYQSENIYCSGSYHYHLADPRPGFQADV